MNHSWFAMATESQREVLEQPLLVVSPKLRSNQAGLVSLTCCHGLTHGPLQPCQGGWGPGGAASPHPTKAGATLNGMARICKLHRTRAASHRQPLCPGSNQIVRPNQCNAADLISIELHAAQSCVTRGADPHGQNHRGKSDALHIAIKSWLARFYLLGTTNHYPMPRHVTPFTILHHPLPSSATLPLDYP